ncbi:protein JASON-like [Asparagus officinalis]|uniref:protein JASON-like n=1 Tax=Asparagus officinalis TaxID=4686 RepID=UPI00098E8051|nr:protein JASON-like [Asparagus officinalis]
MEIRKASEKSIVEISTTDKACKKLHWDEQHDDLSNAATKVNEDSDSLESKAGSFSLEERQTRRKSVRFDEEVDHISGNKLLDSADQNLSPQTGNQTQQLGSDHSPYPTPQSLSEDTQTPRTICTPKSTGNNARIRTQYVYPISNSLQNLSSSEGAQMSNFIQDGEKSQQTSVALCSTELSPDDKTVNDRHTVFKEKIDFNQENPKLVVSSLSQWLKPPLTKEERWEKSNVMNERSPSSKSPNADRPIIGMVAAHWKENEPSSISPKWFDGNGIPNSTNKYKEDQKVSWHATPFEERLEKALSDEKLFPRSELNGRPVDLDDEGEESDTAAS